VTVGDDAIHLNSDPPSAINAIDCGDGNDTVYNSEAPMGRTNRKLLDAQSNCENVIDLDAERDPTRGITWSGNGTKNGSERNDRLNGQHGSNTILGHGGDDVIWGDSAHDTGGSKARAQTDSLDGGPGDDTIYAGRGTSIVVGGDGNDYLQGNGLNSRIAGGNGADNIKLQGRRTTIDAGPSGTVSSTSASFGFTARCSPLR